MSRAIRGHEEGKSCPVYGHGHNILTVPLDPRFTALVEALKDELADRRLTQADVERRLGWAPRYLSKILRGHVGLSVAHLYDVLAKAAVA